MASKYQPKAFVIIQNEIIKEINTKNESNKTYILKIISRLGINIKQFEKET